MLLRYQADVNSRDKNWQTPLHVAAANNAVKCAEFIIPLLTNVNVSDRLGHTSLHHAAFNGHSEVLNVLLDLCRPRLCTINEIHFLSSRWCNMTKICGCCCGEKIEGEAHSQLLWISQLLLCPN